MTEERQSHAHLDLPSRRRKGLKIERILGLTKQDKTRRLLEIGCGSGGISHYFGTHDTLSFNVDAVDVEDNRVVHDGFRFARVASTTLPFADDAFHIVISNHVIEHVGDRNAQLHHLKEIRRVLAPGGQCYLAVPNRWMLVEPHYRLPFLSWVPHHLRTPYLRWARKGTYYDCRPLRLCELEDLLDEAGLPFENRGVRAVREVLSIERPEHILTRMLSRVPDAWVYAVRRIIPTLIYVLRKS